MVATGISPDTKGKLLFWGFPLGRFITSLSYIAITTVTMSVYVPFSLRKQWNDLRTIFCSFQKTHRGLFCSACENVVSLGVVCTEWLLWPRQWTFKFHKRRGITSLPESLASHEEPHEISFQRFSSVKSEANHNHELERHGSGLYIYIYIWQFLIYILKKTKKSLNKGSLPPFRDSNTAPPEYRG
jgi:hypothetical protein